MAKLRYEGPLKEVEVSSFGTFAPGTEKRVDALTAAAFRDERCRALGWRVVEDEPKKPTPAKAPVVTDRPVEEKASTPKSTFGKE